MTEKKVLRQQMMQERDNMHPDIKSKLDDDIAARLLQLIKARNAKVVHSYLPMGSEIDVFPVLDILLRNNIKVISPKTLAARQLENLVLHSVTDLEEGKWGTMHPAGNDIYNGPIDLFIIPGLAFDKNCNRLGYGAGYYDNHLVHQPQAYKLGICYPFQVIDKVPVEAHDIRLNEIMF